jgi:hypothetical protein
MTISKEEVIELARQTGLCECIDDCYQERGDWTPLATSFAAAIEARVRADERWACISIANKRMGFDAEYIADAIRARGNGE